MIEESKIKTELKLLKMIQKKVPAALDHFCECQENIGTQSDIRRAKNLIKQTFQIEIDLLLSNPEHYFNENLKK